MFVCVFGRRKTSIVCCLFMSDCNLVLCWVFSWLICVVDVDWMYVKFQMGIYDVDWCDMCGRF